MFNRWIVRGAVEGGVGGAVVAEVLLEFGEHLADAVDIGHGRLKFGFVHVAEVEGKVELGADFSGRT